MASVSTNPVPLLVSLKAVDPAEYPFYGTAELDPAMPLQQALQGDSAVVADEFLIRLNAHVGDTLRLGGRDFRITAVLKQEPDRISAGMGLGPRVMISQAALAEHRIAGAGQPREPAFARQAARHAAEGRHRRCGDRCDSHATGSGAARRAGDGLPRRQPRAHARPRQCDLDSEPHLPCRDGAGRHRRRHGHARASRAAHGHAGDSQGRSARIPPTCCAFFFCRRWAWVSPADCSAWPRASAVMAALPAAFGQLLPVHVILQFPWQSALAGLGTGLLTTLLFCLPPLLDVRAVRPVLVLRRLVEQGPPASAAGLRAGGRAACSSASQRR